MSQITEYYTDSERGKDWITFAETVLQHIDDYTVPQYGDKGKDLASKKDTRWFVDQIEKYVERSRTNARGPEETKRDLLKIAHYAQLAYDALEK